MLVLHGFPDTAESFRPLLRRLADAGYHAVAPFLRGYAPTERSPDSDYRLSTLSDDVVALMDTLDAEQATVVGHDWGAVIGTTTALRHPQRLHRLVACSVPHLWRFLKAIPTRQGWRSRYILQFQLPFWAEHHLVADDYAGLRALMQRWSPDWTITEADMAPLKRCFATPEGMRAALAYYRQLPGDLLRHPGRLRQAVTVPTTFIHGDRDGCIGPDVFSGQEPLYVAGLETVCLNGVGHFLINEQPGRFCDAVLSAVGAAPGR